MRRRRLLFTALLSLVLIPASISSCKPAEIKVPVNITGASSVGSLHFEAIYDSDSYSAVGVNKGNSFADALLEYDIASPGHVVVGVISSKGISGEGTLATVTLETKKGGGDRVIDIQNVIAHSAADLSELPVNVTPGKSQGKASTPPVIEFLPLTE